MSATTKRCAALIAFALVTTCPVAAQQGVNQKQGFNANNVYSMHDIDTVNAFNGNLTVAIPIGPEFPLADGFSYRLMLHSNGNFWENEVRYDTYAQHQPSANRVRADAADTCNSNDGYTVAFPHRRANAGLGWMLTLGRLYPSASTIVRGWTYQSADGADHAFHSTRAGSTTDDDAIYYTRDNSYLRLNLVNETSGIAIIEFPDGAYHTFKKQGTNNEAPWLPIEIAHRRSNKKLTIDYSIANQWTLTDTHGRSHVIAFTPRPWESGQRPLVSSVTLEVFQQNQAVYSFAYEEAANLPRPDWHEPCAAWPSTTKVQTLKSVTLPSEEGEGTSKYEFAYDVAPLQSPGVLSKAVLPTGGWITWDWDTWEKPQDSAGKIFLAESVGVYRRRMWVPSATGAGTMVAEWTYDSSVDAEAGDAAPQVTEVRTVITDPLNQKTLHLFAATTRNETRDGEVYRNEYYGLPFSQKHKSSDGQYLSQVVYPAGVEPDLEDPIVGGTRATYLVYEGDGASIQSVAPEKNWRVQQKRDWIDGDTVDTVNSNFDGYGNYGTTTTSGFGDASRTTTTSYSAPGANWILGLYDQVTVTDGAGSSSVTEFNFDEDGSLKRTRKRRNASATSVKDLVTVLDDTDDDGMVEAERHYGGDVPAKALASNYDIDGTSDPSVLSYALAHTSENGVRAETESEGASFKTVDLSIDRSGLPSSSTDVSGSYVTTFDYNLRGQLKSVKPGSDAWTEYKYNTNTASYPPASVIVRQWTGTVTTPGTSDTALTEKRHYYDYFGRLIQERTWLASASSSAWSVVTHEYDKLGRRISTSMPVGRTNGDYAAISGASPTTTDYDVLGRVRKVTQPDGTYTETTYTGASTVDRTVSVKTADGEVRVKTTETYDALGRLRTVAEDADGANEVTSYTYDVGDRLTSVTQSTQAARELDYDDAGLLEEETHPESGSTSYEYDARGHVIKKVTETATISMTYDSAERIRTVTQNAIVNGVNVSIPLQEFEYGATGTAKGRLEHATRHNHHADLGGDIQVEETFTYTADGRVSTKTTAITNGPTFTDSYTYDALGARETVTYPSCTGCGTLTAPDRTITNVYTAGLLTGVTGYTNGMTYHSNGVLATLKRRNANGNDGPALTQTIDAANRMPRPASTTLTGHCEFAISVPPPPSKTIYRDEPANISVTAPGATTYEWYVLGSTTKIAGQTTNTLTVPVSQTTQFWVRVGNGTCTVDSGIATVYVQTCTAPDATITAPASVGPSMQGTATVAGTGTYAWTIDPGTGTIVSGQNAKTVTFRSSCSGPVVLRVSVTAACGGTPSSSTMNIPVAAPSVTVSASPSSIVQGQSTTLSVSIADGPWSVTWSDGFVQTGVTGTVSRPVVSPTQTTTYSVTHLNGCEGSYGSKNVTVAPPAPLTTAAARVSGGIQIAWSMPAGASTDSFRIQRCASNCASGSAGWSLAGTSVTSPYVDTSASAGSAYVYRVRAVKAGTESLPGPIDFATHIAFSDDPVVAGITPIRLVHLSELRTAVNALRVAAGLTAASFTDAASPDLVVRSVHFTELRSALNAARSQLGFAGVVFDPPLTTETSVRAAHINQLRGGVR